MTPIEIRVSRFSRAALLLGCIGASACSRSEPSSPTRFDTPTKTIAGNDAATKLVATTDATTKLVATTDATTKLVATTDASKTVAAVDAATEAPVSAKPVLAAAASSQGPHIERLVIARDIKEREPIERGNASLEEPVVAFMEFRNPGSSEFDVMVTFQNESGERVGFIELQVPANMPRFRTWGRTRNIKTAGNWTAIVSTDGGEELARQSFTVGEAS